MEFVDSLVNGLIALGVSLLKLLLVGLALLAIFRAAPIVVPVLARFALAVGQVVGEILAAMFRFLAQFAFVLVRVAVTAGVVYGTLHGAGDVYVAYGGDLPALLLASLLILATVGVGVAGASWGSLLSAGLGAFVIGALALAGTVELRSLLIVGALSTIVADNQLHRRDRNEVEQCVSQVDQDWPGGLHGRPVDRSGSINDAGSDEDLRDRDRVRSGPGASGLG